MEQDEQADASFDEEPQADELLDAESLAEDVSLYDFLYRDSSRITSYYAQLFKGHLTSLEETNSEQLGKERGGKVDAKVISGDLRTSSSVQTGNKRVINPHDAAATDVFNFLLSAGRVWSDVENAPYGAFVLAQGTVVFVDSLIGDISVIALEKIVRAETSKPRNQQNKEQIEEQKLVIEVLKKTAIPSSFFMSTADGIQIVGTIKDTGMEEPISTYHFKHGTSGLAEVFLIGIKESPNQGFVLPEMPQLIGVGQQLAQLLSDSLFPPTATRVTPLALFRRMI